jgi:carboxypeptidase family protein
MTRIQDHMTRLTVALLCGCLVLPAWAQTPRPDRPGSITGRVIRPDGLPQPDAEVVAATRGRDGQLHLSPWRARTAFDGQYAITGVPAGRYLVLVRVVGADAPVDGRPHATLFPGVPTTEAGTAVDVFAGVPAEGVDIWLQPAPRRFQVAGRVVDPGGRPLENVAIEFGPARSRADNVWTSTDPGGLFTLDRVPPGSIVLRARADSPAGPLVGVASVVLAVESAQDLRIEVHEPGRLHGRLVALGGVLPAGMRVVLQPTLLRPSALYPAEEAAVAATGDFEVTGSVGEHELVVQGLPRGWGVHGARPLFWLNAAETLNDVRVDIGPKG